MIPVDTLAAILQVTNPGVDWAVTLVNLSQVMSAVTAVSGTPAVPIPQPFVNATTILTTTIPTTTVPVATDPTPTEPSLNKAVAADTSTPSPKPTLTEPLDISPISMYREPVAESEIEEEEQIPRERGNDQEKDMARETLIREEAKERWGS